MQNNSKKQGRQENHTINTAQTIKIQQGWKFPSGHFCLGHQGQIPAGHGTAQSSKRQECEIGNVKLNLENIPWRSFPLRHTRSVRTRWGTHAQSEPSLRGTHAQSESSRWGTCSVRTRLQCVRNYREISLAMVELVKESSREQWSQRSGGATS